MKRRTWREKVKGSETKGFGRKMEKRKGEIIIIICLLEARKLDDEFKWSVCERKAESRKRNEEAENAAGQDYLGLGAQAYGLVWLVNLRITNLQGFSVSAHHSTR